MTPKGARRLPFCCLHVIARRALLALCLWPVATGASGETILHARYENPTDRYAHGVLGDAIEYATLALTLESGVTRRFSLPVTAVFEDTAPRLVDLDGDERPEVVVVESDQSRGARLVVYTSQGRLTATPYVGTRFRWLAPVGVADLDRDGTIEIAYVDRPHLAKTLRIWRYDAGKLTEVASEAGVTNHRIGEEDIAGGIRKCADVPEMILANASWQSLLALRFDGAAISWREIGADTSRSAFAAALACDDG